MVSAPGLVLNVSVGLRSRSVREVFTVSCLSDQVTAGASEEKPRMNNILTSQTEPYDLSFSRSYQNLTHLLPSYEIPLKSDLGTLFSLFITPSSSLLSGVEM
ncbi:hypothetical protein PDJAM_G00176240 [Pangasius djambal]|uniref:Uncharacterized protein n=1 Tax=Pangasius djambal TaxID=1691987 RepID=A0ACC5ZNH6_9TELE|nr:hypothetical protein [Pangasius djambal]